MGVRGQWQQTANYLQSARHYTADSRIDFELFEIEGAMQKGARVGKVSFSGNVANLYIGDDHAVV
jgi:hypothetical protein